MLLSRVGVRLRPTTALASSSALRVARLSPAAAAATAALASSSSAKGLFGVSLCRQFQTGHHLHDFTNPKADEKTGRILALNRLRPAPGHRVKTVMLGRGEGTHYGKSAGRGMRGTYHRHALRKRNFEGGQTPLHRRIPKRGSHVPWFFRERFTEVSLGRLQYFAETGRIDPTKPIQIKDLYRCGIKPDRNGIKIVGRGAHRLMFPLHLEMSRTDDLAKFAIEQAGGSVKLVYHTRLGMRAHLFPERFAILPSAPSIPPPKKRHHYVPYDMAGVIPPLLFKARITASSPLAKFWTPSPVATNYLSAVARRDEARAKLGITPPPIASSAPKAKAQ